MLTAKQGEHDEAEGLELGADDFLRKPFSFVVLVARLRALVRRADERGRRRARHRRPAHRPASSGGAGGAPTELVLTARELELLVALARRDGGTATKPELLAEVWGFDFDGDENIVEVYVALPAQQDRPAVRAGHACRPCARIGYRLTDDVPA